MEQIAKALDQARLVGVGEEGAQERRPQIPIAIQQPKDFDVAGREAQPLARTLAVHA